MHPPFFLSFRCRQTLTPEWSIPRDGRTRVFQADTSSQVQLSGMRQAVQRGFLRRPVLAVRQAQRCHRALQREKVIRRVRRALFQGGSR